VTNYYENIYSHNKSSIQVGALGDVMYETSRRQLLKGISGIGAGAAAAGVVAGPAAAGTTAGQRTGGRAARRAGRAPGSVWWRAQAEQAARLGTWGVVAGYGMVYASVTPYGEPGLICAFDADTGARSWQSGGQLSQLQTQAAGPGAVFCNANVQVGSAWTAEIVARSAADGGTLWRYDSGQLNALASYSSGMVLVGSYGILTALDARTGHPAWTTGTRQQSFLALAVAGDTVYAVDNGRAGPRPLVAMDTATGAHRWQFTGISGAIFYLTTGDGVLCATQFPTDGVSSTFAVDASDGRMLWQARSDAAAQVISGGNVISWSLTAPVSGPTAIYARHAASGTPAWHRTVPEYNDFLTSDGRALYFGGTADNLVTAYATSTGNPLWSCRTRASAWAAAATGDALYVIDADATVTAIQA
jgi:outer membrane protein assembly factor BamB